MLNQLSIGLSAMRAAQIGLDVTGNNLANANTPNYRRQTPIFAERQATQFGSLHVGNGVDVQRIRQARAELIGSQLLTNRSQLTAIQAQLEVSSQVESRLNPPSGSIAEQFDDFHAALESLAAAPYDSALRATTLQSGLTLTRQINTVASDLIELDHTVLTRIQDSVDQVNALAEQIATLNSKIRQATGQSPNTLIDQRNALTEQLSEFVDVKLDEGNNVVFLARGAITIGTRPPEKLAFDGDNVVIANSHSPLEVGGLIGGLQKARSEIIPRARQRLDDFALRTSQVFDGLHIEGVGLKGYLESVRSTRSVQNPNWPLSSEESPFPVKAGVVYVGVDDHSTQERSLHAIAFDPATDSLRDLANDLNAISGLQSLVDDDGRLVIRANSGFGFDFSGRPESHPDVAGLSGTSVPTLDGRYRGNNRDVRFEFLGSGDIGVTAGLQVSVVDVNTGESLGVFDIGQGYAPGDDLHLPDGITLQLSVGSVVTGESFESPLVSDGDETGVLVRLGVNTLFTGSHAADFTIHPELLADPARLAGSLTGEPGDSQNFTGMLSLRSNLLANDTRTLEDILFTATGAIGHETNALSVEHEGLSLVGEQLFVERESVEGVDPNEELVEMLKYQRAFEAASRYVSVVNQTLQDLMEIVR